MAGLTSHAIRFRLRRAAATRKGLCPRCFKRPSRAPGHSYCKECHTDCRRRYRMYYLRDRNRKRRLGLCLKCDEVPDPGYTQCRIHLARSIRWYRAKRDRLRRAGLCVKCGKARDCALLHCLSCRTAFNQYSRMVRRRLREIVLSLYGHECRCCHVTDAEFLSIDHLRNDGYIERRRIDSISLLKRIVAMREIRGRYQLLCHNCNMAKALFGLCPHQARRPKARGPAPRVAPGRRPAAAS